MGRRRKNSGKRRMSTRFRVFWSMSLRVQFEIDVLLSWLSQTVFIFIGTIKFNSLFTLQLIRLFSVLLC